MNDDSHLLEKAVIDLGTRVDGWRDEPSE